VDWRALGALSVVFFAISVMGLANLISMPTLYIIIINAVGFSLAYLYMYMDSRQSVKVRLEGAQPLPGNLVGDLVGSALVAYGLKEGGSQ
jgi:hypothetical protein